MTHRLEIGARIPDSRAAVKLAHIKSFGYANLSNVELVDVFTVDKDLARSELEKSAAILANPVTHYFQVDQAIKPDKFDWAFEIGFLPGVTDNIGTTAREAIEDLLKKDFAEGEAVYSSQILFLSGELDEKDIENIAAYLTNSLIQRTQIKSYEQFSQDSGMDLIVPKVTLHDKPSADEIEIDLADEALAELGKKGVSDTDENRIKSYRGPLALDLESMQVIKEYFLQTEKRNPTDAELETLAQTWSEHCKHTIFAATLDEIEDGLYKHYIKRATQEIRKQKGDKDFCVSVFTDNSGAIEFDDDYLVTDKAETHNSPSALDPFGGAITGIVGVNRDTIGFGLGAMPLINRYGFCFADPRTEPKLYRAKDKKLPALSPRKIMEGVIAGVNTGGNCSGIPTPQGFIYFDERYAGKPLVFVGTVGLIPKKSADRPSHVKKAKPGDLIVMIGGRVGKDGIHGATFSSEALDTGSPVSAVQIGDPITQKKFSDAIVKEARDLGLYHAITDNGAGGLSSSVGEMARDPGGCIVDLDKVPLKYPGLSPWEIWISESQERMTLAIPEDKLDEFNRLMQRRGVESTVIGRFTDSGRCVVTYERKNVVDMDLDFMHNGLPHKVLESIDVRRDEALPRLYIDPPTDLSATLHQMLQRLNICSYDFISYQFDHVVQGSAALQPLQGKGKVNADATIVRPILMPPLIKGGEGGFNPWLTNKGIITSQALYPSYSDIDTYHMAAASIDTAIRNVICVGGSLDRLALMDNFCWCSSEDPKRLGQLKRAAQACYDCATACGTPFISGKDSMFNDFKGYDEDNNPIKISVPPTLLISSLGVMDDVTKAVSLDAKIPGDLVYILGLTKDELGASEYVASVGTSLDLSPKNNRLGNVPTVDTATSINRYRTFMQAIDQRLIASAISITRGGLGVALAKMAIAGQLGMQINLTKVPIENINRDDYVLFSETQSRIVVTIDPANQGKFEQLFADQVHAQIGKITDENEFIITGLDGSTIIDCNVGKLDKKYKKPLHNY